MANARQIGGAAAATPRSPGRSPNSLKLRLERRPFGGAPARRLDVRGETALMPRYWLRIPAKQNLEVQDHGKAALHARRRTGPRACGDPLALDPICPGADPQQPRLRPH